MSYDTENIFAKILRNEVPCETVFHNEHVLAFKDIQPAAPVHILVIPRGHYVSYDDFIEKASTEAVHAFFTAVQQIAKEHGVDKTGYRLITNHGEDASQTVPHFHMHILGGRPLGGLVTGDDLIR